MKLTDERIDELWGEHLVPVFGGNLGYSPTVFARAIEAELEKQAQVADSLDDWLDTCDESGSSIQHRIECAGLNEILHWVERAFNAGRDSVERQRWISVDERMPEPGEDVIVWGQSFWETKPSAKFDSWVEQHEEPCSPSSAIVPAGFGWCDHDAEAVTHWMKKPAPPAAQDTKEKV